MEGCNMTGLSRIFVGLVGGFMAATSKILAVDVTRLGEFVSSGMETQSNELIGTLYVITPALMIMGAVVAWATDESNRVKLLAIGAPAPAIVAPWTGGAINSQISPADILQPTAAQGYYSVISTAHAEGIQKSPESNFVKGVKNLLGISKFEEKNYWVIVGSHKDKQEATAQATLMNQSNPELQAFVGLRKPENPYYPVIVGGTEAYKPLSQAKILMEQATASPVVPDNAYLSDYKDRVPQ